MTRSTPSLLALLGLVAVAGYQNRDRISDMLSDARQKSAAAGSLPPSQDGGFLSEIGQFFRGSPVSTALNDLVDRFRQSGRGAAADSWVSDKANIPLGQDDLKTALGPETIAELARRTGLSQVEVLLRLNAALPDVVNKLTPNGRLPTDAEAQALI